MTEHAAGVVDKQALDLGGGVAALRQQHVERSFAAALRVRFNRGDRRRCCVNHLVLRQSLRPGSLYHDRGHCSVRRGLRPGPVALVVRALAFRLILVGCPGLPMTQVPDFLLEIPNIRQPSAYSQARRRYRTGGTEVDCAGRV